MKLVHNQPDPVDTRVGATIRALRKHRGMSQEALAQQLGVTFQQVQKYERGANRISASMLVRAAKALDVPVARFFDGVDVEAVPPDPLEVEARAIYEAARTAGAVAKAWGSLDETNPWDALLIEHAYERAAAKLHPPQAEAMAPRTRSA